MLVLKRAQRAMFADKLPDLANLAVAAPVFGQAFSARFSPSVAVLGVALWVVLIGWAAILSGRNEL